MTFYIYISIILFEIDNLLILNCKALFIPFILSPNNFKRFFCVCVIHLFLLEYHISVIEITVQLSEASGGITYDENGTHEETCQLILRE